MEYQYDTSNKEVWPGTIKVAAPFLESILLNTLLACQMACQIPKWIL